jgi:Mn-dependent DtxR family transcriptional regulator
MIRNRVIEILNEKGEIELKELISEIGEHPKVVKDVVKELAKEGKITIRKEKLRHKPKKFKIIISL